MITSALICNLTAIENEQRQRYVELVQHVRAAMRRRIELESGYAFTLDASVVTLPETAEWMEMERQCCPFLTLQLSATGTQSDWTLTLTGPDGVKRLLDSEFPSRA